METKRKEETEEFKWNPIWRERERKREGVIEHKGSQVRGKTEGEIGKVSAAERGYQRNTARRN